MIDEEEEIDLQRIFVDKVNLQGFKSIENLSIDFQKSLNILIGKNGSGKSNLMEFLFQAINFNRDDKIFYKNATLELVSADNHSFVIELEKAHSKIAKEKFKDRIGLSERFFIDNELVLDNSAEDNIPRTFEFQKRKIDYQNNLSFLLVSLGYEPLDPLFIKFNIPDKLEFIDNPGTLIGNIEDSFLYWDYPETLDFMSLAISGLESFFEEHSSHLENSSTAEIIENLEIEPEIIENLSVYTPIADMRFSNNVNLYRGNKGGSRSIIIENIKLEFKINGNWLPWSQLSDGTKRLFYIIAEVTNTNGLVLIEEPELGIHPHQFNLLMDFLKEQSEHKQIIISTHSPKALDYLSEAELNSILITYYDLKKGTQIRHLTGKEITKAKKYMKEVGFFSDYWLLSDLEQ